jgi:hypothetical protein
MRLNFLVLIVFIAAQTFGAANPASGQYAPLPLCDSYAISQKTTGGDVGNSALTIPTCKPISTTGTSSTKEPAVSPVTNNGSASKLLLLGLFLVAILLLPRFRLLSRAGLDDIPEKEVLGK